MPSLRLPRNCAAFRYGFVGVFSYVPGPHCLPMLRRNVPFGRNWLSGLSATLPKLLASPGARAGKEG
jgi:hypothetical protein